MSNGKQYTFYSTFRSNFFNKKNDYEPAFNKMTQKNEQMSFELEKYKDEIMKLKQKLNNQNNEIKLLKVTNNKKDDDFNKMLKIFQDVLNKTDKSTQFFFNNLIEESLNNNNKISNKKKIKNENESDFKFLNESENENNENNN